MPLDPFPSTHAPGVRTSYSLSDTEGAPMIDEQPASRRSRTARGPGWKTVRRVFLWGVSVAALVALAGGSYWALTCPCETTPGFVLRGQLHHGPVRDWRIANDVELCQIQITIGIRPHSLNLNCMATPSGELYLSCSFGDRKYWCPRVGPDEPGRLRLDGVVYPVVLNRVTDPATLDEAWTARITKLQDPDVQARQPPGSTPPPLDAERPESWWTFHVQSAPSE
jgi:hypothetical protein